MWWTRRAGEALESRGVGAMEMKRMGLYACRTLGLRVLRVTKMHSNLEPSFPLRPFHSITVPVRPWSSRPRRKLSSVAKSCQLERIGISVTIEIELSKFRVGATIAAS